MFGCTDCTPLTVTNVEKSLLSNARVSSQLCNAREYTMPTRKADKAPIPNTERRDRAKSTSPRITTVQRKTATRANSHGLKPMHFSAMCDLTQSETQRENSIAKTDMAIRLQITVAHPYEAQFEDVNQGILNPPNIQNVKPHTQNGYL